MTVFQQQLLQKLEHSESVADDSDKAFMLSILPDVKKLDDDEKLDFRYHVLQFFRDRRNKRNPTHSIAQPSTSFYLQPPTSSYLQPPTPSSEQYSTFHPQHQIPYQQIHLNTSQSSIVVSSPSPGSSLSSPAEHIHYSDSSNFTDL
ncbi:hypothetical protein JTB14_010357 [Gonioctena quinquepunctata]|nr:hypothetical protein JTB14_010357 [Gonioctena quinquepunctata]